MSFSIRLFLKPLLPILLLTQILHSCGVVPEEPVSSVTCIANCSSTTSTSAAENTGVFVDSAVAGVTFTTSSGLSGTTNSSGEFGYRSGDTASFSIGDVDLGDCDSLSGTDSSGGDGSQWDGRSKSNQLG